MINNFPQNPQNQPQLHEAITSSNIDLFQKFQKGYKKFHMKLSNESNLGLVWWYLSALTANLKISFILEHPVPYAGACHPRDCTDCETIPLRLLIIRVWPKVFSGFPVTTTNPASQSHEITGVATLPAFHLIFDEKSESGYQSLNEKSVKRQLRTFNIVLGRVRKK